MKKMNEMMKDLGFNPNGSDSVKEAFVKNLIKAAYGVNVVTPTEKKIIQDNPQKIVSFKSSKRQSLDQLSFNFDGLEESENSKLSPTKKSV